MSSPNRNTPSAPDATHRRRLAALILVGLPVAAAACQEPEPPLTLPDDAELRLVEDASGRPVAVDAVGLAGEVLDRLRRASWNADEWSAIFAVAGAEGAPVAGDYRVTSDAVRFIPNAPFARRTRYVASWKDVGESELAFEPSLDGSVATTQVAAIYPSADLLPQNLARLHIQFTGPMTQGKAGDYVRLVSEESGAPLDPFAHAEPEASAPVSEQWSEDGRTLTIELGRDAEERPLIQIASRYRLIVDRGWEDAEGVPLRDTFEKVFAVTKNDRDLPDPNVWHVTPPVSTGAPLVVDFPAPLDHVRLEKALAVLSPRGTLAGSIRISNEERRWVFSPKKPWSNGRYFVRVVDVLDDPAGNLLGGEQAMSAEAGTVVPFLVDIPEPPKRTRRGG